jgi:Spy/CpxP family protein refolding chaperone
MEKSKRKQTRKENHKMKTKLTIATTLLFILLFVVVSVSPASAFQGRGRGMGPGGGPGYGPGGDPAVASGLNLTAEQQAKIADLRAAHFKDIKPLRDKMFSLRGDLRLLWLEKNPDQAKITATQKEIRSLRDQMQDKGTAYRLEVNKVLTPEQQAQFRSTGPGGGFGPGYGRGGRGPGYGPGGGMGMGRGHWGNW